MYFQSGRKIEDTDGIQYDSSWYPGPDLQTSARWKPTLVGSTNTAAGILSRQIRVVNNLTVDTNSRIYNSMAGCKSIMTLKYDKIVNKRPSMVEQLTPDMVSPQGGLTLMFCCGVTVTANKLANLPI